MPEIRVLDDVTIDKIAAGEVVERPVNVVKELVENAIDSGADAISIEIKGGGCDLIRVTDNGCGIKGEDIQNAFCRHATSKIRSIDDLTVMMTLGFRGEALSSIAAVSKTELLSKSREEILGHRYVIHGGKTMSFDDAGVPDGTTIIVKDLFYNTPARKKFLKSAATEGGYITELIERLILSHPSVSFKFVSQGIVRLSSDGRGDIESDIYSVFGRDIRRNVVNVGESFGDLSVEGFVGKPEISRGNRNFEIFFVNGRYVKSKVLTLAVEEAYKPYLMLHRFPFVVLYINIAPQLIDVNVHPAKTEIRFSDETAVRNAVFSVVTEGITRKELIPEEHAAPEKISRIKESAFSIPEPFESENRSLYKESSAAKPVTVAQKPPVYEQETLFKEGFLSEKNHKKHCMIGQVFDTYWLISYEDKLYIIDQHAAHEKVLYERFSKKILSGAVSSQMISPPYIVSLSVSEEETVKRYMDVFSSLGFTIEHFGQREYAISSVPVELFGISEQEYFKSVVDDLSEQTHNTDDRIKLRIATMACKAAVKGNMKMTEAEADALIKELFECDNPYNCPHGRPTVISFSKEELEKMFKRIV